jgi:hypothetical protein
MQLITKVAVNHYKQKHTEKCIKHKSFTFFAARKLPGAQSVRNAFDNHIQVVWETIFIVLLTRIFLVFGDLLNLFHSLRFEVLFFVTVFGFLVCVLSFMFDSA